MQQPDFALPDPRRFDARDLLFVFEHFPGAPIDAVEAVRRLHEQPAMLDSLLESRFLRDALLDPASACIDVSPRLFFDVMLRHALPGPRDGDERIAIHYLAQLLALFADTERLHRPGPDDDARYEYLVDLVQASAEAGPQRRFLVDAHIANYAMFIAGMRSEWVEHRQRYRRRPMSLDYYRQVGRSYYLAAASHPLSLDFGLRPVFRIIANRFEHFRGGLQRLAAMLGEHRASVHGI